MPKISSAYSIMVILFNKPFGVLSQFTPEAGHRALNEFGFPAGVYAAGRLDHDSEGALLLTDEGKLIKKLLDPKFEHPRTYLAQVDGQITQEAVNQLKKGVYIKGYHTKPCQAEIVNPPEKPLGAGTAYTLSCQHPDQLGQTHPHRRQKPPGAPHDRRRGFSYATSHPRTNRPTHFG